MSSILFPVIRTSEQVLPYVLNGAASDFNITRINRPHGLESGWWLQTRSGSGQVIARSLKATVGLNQAVWIAPGDPHELIADSEGWSVDWLSFSGSGLMQLAAGTSVLSRSTAITLLDDGDLMSRIHSIVETRDDLSPSANRERSAMVYSFLLEIENQFTTNINGSRSQREQRLKPILDYITSHYQETINLQTLADLMDVTPQHLCTLFRKLMGMRIFEYINLIRIQFSKAELITLPEKPIRAVAHESGFEDVSYFCSIFKRFESMTPGEYRKLFLVL
ncbi:MAG: AraC family transcriptional regulator [Eubacteriales bacterium]|nr:AraC family transcriptional regulator [Eubacteriales bacterium]